MVLLRADRDSPWHRVAGVLHSVNKSDLSSRQWRPSENYGVAGRHRSDVGALRRELNHSTQKRAHSAGRRTLKQKRTGLVGSLTHDLLRKRRSESFSLATAL